MKCLQVCPNKRISIFWFPTLRFIFLVNNHHFAHPSKLKANCSMWAESLTEHLKRRAAVLAERVELELSVAGTEYAPLERAIFKATKNNTKVPKEKHVIGGWF